MFHDQVASVTSLREDCGRERRHREGRDKHLEQIILRDVSGGNPAHGSTTSSNERSLNDQGKGGANDAGSEETKG